MAGHFEAIRGDTGYVTASAGATVATIGKWIIVPSGTKPDGTVRLQFKAQFSFRNDTLMGMIGRGQLKGRIVVQMRRQHGIESIDILDWQEWHFEGGVLRLEDITRFENVKARPISLAR